MLSKAKFPARGLKQLQVTSLIDVNSSLSKAKFPARGLKHINLSEISLRVCNLAFQSKIPRKGIETSISQFV